MGQRTDGDLGGHHARDGIHDGECKEAQLAEPADDEHRQMNGGLPREPVVYAAKERDYESHLAREERRQRNGQERGGAPDGEGGEDDHAEHIECDRGPERLAQNSISPHCSSGRAWLSSVNR